MPRVTFNRREAVQIDNLHVSPGVFGRTWYIDSTNGSNSNTGLDPNSAFADVAQARSSSNAGDTVVLAPGSYTVDVGTDGGMAPKADQTWMAAVPSYCGAPNVIITQDADDNVASPIILDVDGVIFKDIEFRLVAGGTTALYLVDISQTTAVRGAVFKDCWFNMNSVEAADTFAVRLNDATNASTGIVFAGCRFIGGDLTTNQTVYIQIGVGGAPDLLIEHCTFALQSADGDARAIEFLDPAASGKSYAHTIRFNTFIGPMDGGGDAAPIEYATAMTDNELVGAIHDNIFANCTAVSITQDEASGSAVNNYVNSAAGGALVDVTA